MTISIDKLRQVAKITVTCLEEHTPPGGDIPDDAEYVATVKALYDQSPWGWCCVRVTASYAGLSVDEYLGCCSYESEEAFLQEGDDGYYVNMVTETLQGLAVELENAVEACKALEEVS